MVWNVAKPRRVQSQSHARAKWVCTRILTPSGDLIVEGSSSAPVALQSDDGGQGHAAAIDEARSGQPDQWQSLQA